MLCVVLQDTSLLMSFIADEYADVLILGFVVYTLCRDIGCMQTAGVYVCMYSPKLLQPTEIASSLTLDPNVPLSLCITYINIYNTHTHTHTQTDTQTQKYMHIVQDQKCAMTK